MHFRPVRKNVVVLCLSLAPLFFAPTLRAQQNSSLPDAAFFDSSLPTDQRVHALISQMTLEEKASQLVNQARAIPRLNIPAYDWWSESLHGVMTNGTTEFPEPVGLASTFDVPTIHTMATVISTEARIKHVQFLRAGHSDIFEGLDFWAPNINIFRDPRWGRGQETYGEDPFLTGRLGVAFVTGMQGDDPRYYRAISTPKHFAVHSGPETTRHKADVTVSKHDELDTYLPAFRATVTEAHAGSVMCAYNSINGEPACANQFLLVDQLRGAWKFNGYVVSDCAAVRNIFDGHKFRPSQAEASAISLHRGMDNECIDFTTKVTDNNDYAPYIEAVKKGYLQESDIDLALTRLFTARIKLGMFDPPSMVPFSTIDESLLDGPTHRTLARQIANEAMVLLKNDGTLPLNMTSGKILVVGPLANQTSVLLGNYNGTPTHTVSVLEGMRAVFPAANLRYVPGTQFLTKDFSPAPAGLFSSNGKPGFSVAYFADKDRQAFLDTAPSLKPIATGFSPSVGVTSLPAAAASEKFTSVRWTATVTPSQTGDFFFAFRGEGDSRIILDNVSISRRFTHENETASGQVHLEKGKTYNLVVDYARSQASNAPGQLLFASADRTPSPEALAAAKDSDVIVAVVGITSELEGEEMTVTEPGFVGGDRTSLDLPKPEQDLLESLVPAHKPMVVVLLNGSALSVNWVHDHANSVLEAWYPGEEGGAAVAQTLAGINNPAGRLPVTFYKSVNDLPPFEDYSMATRTYRYFPGQPLYPFGFGLSYSKFEYSNLHLSTNTLNAGDPLSVDSDVKNTSSVDGDEVAELYLSFPKLPGAPLRALRGFSRVHVKAGETAHVHFTLSPRDLSHVSDAAEILVSPGAYTLSVGGGQPNTSAPNVTAPFTITGQSKLPE